MTIVIVGGSLPYPPTAGNRIRTLNLLIRLARKHRVILVAHRNPDEREQAEGVEHLRVHGVETVIVDHVVPPKSGPAFYLRLVGNLASPLPYSIASHVGGEMRRAVLELEAKEKVDVWQAEGLPFFEPLRSLRDARTLVMAHNVETLIWRRYHENEPRRLKRLYIQEQWRKFAAFEGRAFREATRVIAVSEEDAKLAREQFGVERIDVVDNGIDRAYFEAVRPERDPNRILFLGSLEWRPNLDAVGLLLDRIFPAVRAAVPDAKLWIVGRNPPPRLVKRAAETPGVELLANVPDVRPYLAQSAVMAVPLRIGGGSRLKILEALATGLPVVSTSVGAEGLRLDSGRHLDIADDDQAMTDALIRALRDPDRSNAIAAEGRERVLAEYDWDVLAEKYEASLEACRHG